MRLSAARSAALAALLIFAFCTAAQAAEIKVMISGGFSAAYKQLAPIFEKKTGHKIETAYGPSMGETPQAIPNRIARGEPVDVVIMVGYAVDDLVKKGQVAAGSRVDLAESAIAMAVREGTPKPDIGSVEAFKRALLNAKSIVYSDSASGVYLSTQAFPKLGIFDQIKDKSRMIPAEPVAQVVARGEAEIGFQQVSELKPVAGIAIVGPIPAEVQKITVFSAGIASNAQQPEAAKALVAFLGSADAAPIVAETGLKPFPH